MYFVRKTITVDVQKWSKAQGACCDYKVKIRPALSREHKVQVLRWTYSANFSPGVFCCVHPANYSHSPSPPSILTSVQCDILFWRREDLSLRHGKCLLPLHSLHFKVE